MQAGRRQTLIEVLEQQIPECSHAPVIARLRCFRGIDTLTAAGIATEVGNFARFPKPTLLPGFLGIVPSERTSDTKRRLGSITKAGPPHARRPLVEAAHHYRYPPRNGDTLARRQHEQDPRITEIASRAQRHLHARWQHLQAQQRKPAGVAAITVSRELAAFLWEAATLDRPPYPHSRPGRCRGEHEHPGKPITIARGSREHYGQPAPLAAPALRRRAATNTRS